MKSFAHAAPAVTTIRGFHTPQASGDDDSDYGTGNTPKTARNKKFDDVVSANCSPMLRPTSQSGVGGISKLKLQLETLSLASGDSRTSSLTENKSRSKSRPQTCPGTPSESGYSDSATSENTSYDIPLENDFVSEELREKPLYGAVEGGLVQDNIARKMTASDFVPLKCLGTGNLFSNKTVAKSNILTC